MGHRLHDRALVAAVIRGGLFVLLLHGIWPAAARGCPFCTVLKPSLSEQRDAATVVALAELSQSKRGSSEFLIHKCLKGAELIGGRDRATLAVDCALKPGALAILLGKGTESELSAVTWTIVGVNETSYAYFARAPSLRTPAPERLRYFAPFLEHPDPLVAEDAYLEFGHAPFGTVAESIELLPMDRLRRWIVDEKVPQTRKGFYGLALGLANGVDDRRKNAEVLHGLILAPASDFRAGFDGVLGGYLLLEGKPGLKLIRDRYLANKDAADGDVRHALTALRFYHEFGRDIPAEQLLSAVRLLLVRPEFADGVVVDLARWQDWSVVQRVADMYGPKEFNSPSIRRAIVGYLTACPNKDAAIQLARLKQTDPTGVAEAERALSTPAGAK